jgi:hypothetical protein
MPRKRTDTPLPRITSQSHADKVAMNAVEALFLENGGHQLDRHSLDYGVDGTLIFNEAGGAPGYSTNLQVKGTYTHDTDTKRGFKFRCEVKTIKHLIGSLSPSYWVVHNCRTKTTYAREVHELAVFLDQCCQGWRKQEKVTVTFLENSRLTPERIAKIAAESRAWAFEHEKTMETVKYLEKQVRRFATIRSSEDQGRSGNFVWIALKGGFVARRAGDVLGVLEFVGNLMYGLSLCTLYRQRAEKGYRPYALSSTGFGTLDITELTARLNTIEDRHRDLLRTRKDLIRKTTPTPASNPDWKAPRERGLLGPDIEELDAETAIAELTAHLERLGLRVRRDNKDPLDLLVECGDAKGILSLGVFGTTVSQKRTRATRDRLNEVSACAATLLIKLCQGEKVGFHRWDKPETELHPKIPIGTALPLLDEFEADLISGAIERNSWPEQGYSATRTAMGYAHRMPIWTEPDSDLALAHQQGIVRRYARDALADVRRYMPFTFAFHWGMDRVEAHVITCPAELAAYVLVGPKRFHDLGGMLSRTTKM